MLSLLPQRLLRSLVRQVATIFPKPIRKPIYLLLGTWSTYAILWVIYYATSQIASFDLFSQFLLQLLTTMKSIFLQGFSFCLLAVQGHTFIAMCLYALLLFSLCFILTTHFGANAMKIRVGVLFFLFFVYLYLYYKDVFFPLFP